jgi:hypothetical protein
VRGYLVRYEYAGNVDRYLNDEERQPSRRERSLTNALT